MESTEIIRAIEANLEGFLLEFCRTPESDVLRTPEYIQVLTPQPIGMFNLVVGATLQPDRAELLVEEITERFAAMGVPACWWITPSTLPTDLVALLDQEGWSHSNAWRGMVRDLEELPPLTEGGHDLTVTAIRSHADVAAWLDVFRQGFGSTARLQHALEEAWHGRHLPFTLYLAHCYGKAVGTGLLFRSEITAGVYCVCTLPEYRGRGVATRLMQVVMHEAALQGCRQAIVQSTEMGRGLYQRLGFYEVGRFRMLDRRPD